MINEVATFEKVSFEQYQKDLVAQRIVNSDDDAQIEKYRTVWENITLPKRATQYSAGYDFYIPNNIALTENAPVTIPTGVRVKINPGWMLALFPRSGLGFKYGVRLANTVGIIDGDYYFANNEGHIMAKIDSRQPFSLNEQDRFMQGIFMQYGVTVDDAASEPGVREGGFGSTGR